MNPKKSIADSIIELETGFNVRVYGILPDRPLSKTGEFRADTRILYCEEIIQGKNLRKFPGGGVEFAEAPGEALIREFQEEANLEIELIDLLFVSPNFHRSFFRPQQLIGLYWLIKPVNFKDLKEQILSASSHPQEFRWGELKTLEPGLFSHPLDQEVMQYLRENFRWLKP